MAAFGANYLRYAKIKEMPEGKLPVYDSEIVTLGGLVKADLTVNFASGEMYSDDALSERVEEFVSGSISAEVDELEDKQASLIYGAKLNKESELVNNSGDEAPYGGLGYYKSLVKNKKKFYRGYFYPKVSAVLGNDSAATKSSNITLAATPINFTVSEPESGDWRYTKKFDTAEEAKKWIDGKLGNSPAASAGQESTEG